MGVKRSGICLLSVAVVHLVVVTVQAFEFRLRKFDNFANDGVPEIFYNNTWGAVDFKDFVNENSDWTAKALCQSMGFGYEGFATYNIYHIHSTDTVMAWLSGFVCNNNITNATDCVDESTFILRNTTVQTILHCYAFNATGVRLTDGVVPNEGLVEIRISQRWGALQYTEKQNVIDLLDDMICQTLGYIEEAVFQPDRYGPSYTIMTIVDPSCPNKVTTIPDITKECTFLKGIYGPISAGAVYKDLRCLPARLVDGPTVLEGRVEVGLFGQLHTICGFGFDEKAANVTCKSLGYSGHMNFNLKTVYGFGTLPLYRKRITCTGREKSLENCIHSDTDIGQCSSDDIVSVTCKGGDAKLEILNPSRPYEGFLKAQHAGVWYDILSNVTTATARIVCGMLGFGKIGFTTLSRLSTLLTYYKNPVTCRGNELHIDQCAGDFQYCPYQNGYACSYISVSNGRPLFFCSNYEIEDITAMSGVVEVKVNNETWSVCPDNFSIDAATVVCRTLGHQGGASFQSAASAINDKEVIGSLICTAGASYISQCKIQHKYFNRLHGVGEECVNKTMVSCSKECRQGFFGTKCELCRCAAANSLSCDTVSGACKCKNGWTGSICDTDINECLNQATHTCILPWECVNIPGSFYCQCQAGMYRKDSAEGTTCEVCMNNTFGINCMGNCDCNMTNTNVSNPLHICDKKSGYCFCVPEWTGSACEDDFNECLSGSSPCQEPNTQFFNEPGGYMCNCADGFGRNNGSSCVRLDVASESNTLIIVIASAVGGAGSIFIIILIVCCWWRRRKDQSASTLNTKAARTNNAKEGGQNNQKKEIATVQRRIPMETLGESGHYDKVDDDKLINNDISSGYMYFTRSKNDHYDVPQDKKGNEYFSDGYLKPIGKEANDGYIKPIGKAVNVYNEYTKPVADMKVDDYLKLQRNYENM